MGPLNCTQKILRTVYTLQRELGAHSRCYNAPEPRFGYDRVYRQLLFVDVTKEPLNPIERFVEAIWMSMTKSVKGLRCLTW